MNANPSACVGPKVYLGGKPRTCILLVFEECRMLLFSTYYSFKLNPYTLVSNKGSDPHLNGKPHSLFRLTAIELIWPIFAVFLLVALGLEWDAVGVVGVGERGGLTLELTSLARGDRCRIWKISKCNVNFEMMNFSIKRKESIQILILSKFFVKRHKTIPSFSSLFQYHVHRPHQVKMNLILSFAFTQSFVKMC